MPPHKIRFAFFWTVGISLFYHEINIFNVTETIVSRETKAIAARAPQRSKRRHIEKNTGFLKNVPTKARSAQQNERRTTPLKSRPIIFIPFMREL